MDVNALCTEKTEIHKIGASREHSFFGREKPVHLFQKTDNQPYAKMKDIIRYCSNCQKIYKLDCEPQIERQLLERFVDDIICTVNGEPVILLRKETSFI